MMSRRRSLAWVALIGFCTLSLAGGKEAALEKLGLALTRLEQGSLLRRTARQVGEGRG